MRPKILLYADSYNGRVGTSDAYADFFSQFGEVILITPMNDLKFFMDHCDILALPGGADVDPMRYGESPTFWTGRSNLHYEFLDKYLLTPWLATGKPIIGICRGAQTLNVALGGNLIHHVEGHVGGEERGKTEDVIYTNIPGYPMHLVNSYHHQALGNLGDGLEVIGWGTIIKNCVSLRMAKDKLLKEKRYDKVLVDSLSREEQIQIRQKFQGGRPKSVYRWSRDSYYAIPEIVRHTDRPYVAFQYHPEEFNCDLAVELIATMLDEYFEEQNKLILLSQNGNGEEKTHDLQVTRGDQGTIE